MAGDDAVATAGDDAVTTKVPNLSGVGPLSLRTMLSLYPRKAPGLPPGQRELSVMPRFSDKPLRWAPPVAPMSLTISVNGRPVAQFGEPELRSLPVVERTSDIHCVTTWSVRGLWWRGWPLVDVLAEAGLDPAELPAYGLVKAADRRQAIYLTEDLVRPDVLLATDLNGEPLTRRHGAPLRLVCPAQYAYKSVKHVVSIDFVTDQPASDLGPKEHLRARVAQEERHSRLPNRLLRLPYRLTIAPTALAAERGLRNSPSE